MLALLATPGVAAGDQQRPELDGGPGTAPAAAAAPRTLRSLLEELCAREGVRLRYEGPSRWAPALAGEPSLARALPTLLAGVNYVQTVRQDPESGATRLTALHVLGPDGAPAGGAAPRDEPFAVQVTLLDAVFGGADVDAASIERLIADVRSHPDRVEAFLATDTAMMAGALRRYPNAPRVLRAIAARADVDPRSRAKLGEILAALE